MGTDVAEDTQKLISALEKFRAEKGFGRGIAAPQIGILRRFIALNLGDGPQILLNPRITWRSTGNIWSFGTIS